MGKKILVVDDEPSIRDLLKKIFSREGYSVTVAEDGETALQLLKKELFPVIFVDLQMPGISGLELCQQIRKDFPLSFMYAMTGFVSMFALTECREAGFDDYFIKPVKRDLFLKTVREAFEKIERWKKKS